MSVRWSTTLARWTLGVVLVSWRYLWAITPLHRSVEAGDASDLPPPLPDQLVDDRSQPMECGVGPLFRRLFAVEIEDPSLTAEELTAKVAADLNEAVPSEVTAVERMSGSPGDLAVGDEVVVRMPGPWDGPVRVVHRTSTSFRLATLAGHLEAGQIEFRVQPAGSRLRFEIEAWARPSSRAIDLLYTRLRLAKEIQLNMWVRFCLTAAEIAGGRARGGVTIRTRVVDQVLWAGDNSAIDALTVATPVR
ncbi:MAG: DUF1990 domain-containing protein [Actinomycetota bacterium]|nr:DUF1990 domain-containing protein [Actinomycetota bacterium]